MSSPTERTACARAFWLDHFVPGEEVFSREGVRRLYEAAVPPILHATDAVWMREGRHAVGAQTLWAGFTPLVGPLKQIAPTGHVASLLGFTSSDISTETAASNEGPTQ